MAIITLTTNLITALTTNRLIVKPGETNLEKGKAIVGSLTFSFDDTQRIKITSEQPGKLPPDIKITAIPGFFLINLGLKLHAEIVAHPKFKDKTNFAFSQRQLEPMNLAYIQRQENEKTSFQAMQKVKDKFFPGWKIQLFPDVFFVTTGRDWGIDLTSEGSTDKEEISGFLSPVEIVHEKPKPVTEKKYQLPKQSPPVNRRIIFDPNQNNADPAFALGSDPNDPMRFSDPFDCGCYVLSGISLTRCLAGCGITW